MALNASSRPKSSPYASQPCKISFRDGEPLYVHWHFINKCDLLASRILSMSGGSGIPTSANIDDIAYNAGHVIVHYLVTGQYQSLEPEEATHNTNNSCEFAKALRIYNAAVALRLLPIRDLLKESIPSMCEGIAFEQIIEIMEKASFPLSGFPELSEYLESRLLHTALFGGMCTELKIPDTIGKLLFRVLTILNNKEFSQASKSRMTQLKAGLTEMRMRPAYDSPNAPVDFAGTAAELPVDLTLRTGIVSPSEQPKFATEVDKDDQRVESPSNKKVAKVKKVKKNKKNVISDEVGAKPTASAEAATPSCTADTAESKVYRSLSRVHKGGFLPEKYCSGKRQKSRKTVPSVCGTDAPGSHARTPDDDVPFDHTVSYPEYPVPLE
ncbi:hypothetical protein FSARC_4847 [Fusarium sarcochroum]|uniref:BTB domain-containing protein n=1 Tax=Fusarium sarcochroum TaxID=1208366 RepID=A0A8H4XA70_9HYPO|nr:hypothetical protein FSARC_4847 [Fusarium sarcochroum]